MPTYLAGRDEDINNIEQMFISLSLNIPTQSVVFSGLRGVGKTVLINKLQSIAEAKGIFCRHIEIEEKKDFISQIVACSQAFLRKISTKEKFKALIEKALDALKSLVISFDTENSTFSLSIQERELYTSSSLTQSLTDVFTAIGETAYSAETPVCFFIDEIQYMKAGELGSLIAALHRANQLGYPIMVVGAGLPKIYKMLSEEKSYSERLFVYKEIGSLSAEQAREAIIEPARQLNREYAEAAVDKIIEVTKGYPFFIQQMCQIVYNNADNNVIELADVENAVSLFFNTLDTGFFKVRYERCSDGDKKFIFAMVSCGSLPCTVSNIAMHMGKSVRAISTIRAQLINRGIIYAVKHSELDFTVPEFKGFIQRTGEYTQWLEERHTVVPN